MVQLRAYAAAIRRLTDLTTARLLALWVALGSWTSQDDIDTWQERSEPLLASAATATSTLTVARLRLSGIDVQSPALDTRSDPRDPFIGLWAALSAGRALSAGVEASGPRLRANVVDRSMAAQAAVNTTAESTGRIVGWRRVPQGSTCRYCITASTQRYTSERSARAVGHRNYGKLTCDCNVVPIIGTSDPGQVLNNRTLQAVKGTDAAYLDATTLNPADRPDRGPTQG